MNNFKLKKLVIFSGDILALYFSLYLALLLRYWQAPTETLWQNHFGSFSLIFIGWIIIFYIAGLYDLHFAINNAKFFGKALRSILTAGLLSAAFFYLNPQISIAPKRNLLIFIAVFAIIFFAWRNFLNWLLKSMVGKNNIAIVGFNKEAEELIKELKEKPHLGYRVAFLVDDKINIESVEGIKVIKKSGQILSEAKENKITAFILSFNPDQSGELRASLFSCLPLKISFTSTLNFYESITGKVPIEAINQTWFLENLSEGNKLWFDTLKRSYDIILSLVMFAATVVFWPLIIIFIKIESKGPAFFTQIRYGKNNKQFQIIKFRTMATEKNDFSPTETNDKRVTKFGNFLRKARIDELPQVINILRGDMSFVGPRPERPELIKELEQKIPFYNERMLVKPGITGSDQISGEYHSPSYEDSLKKLQYDLFYIKNRSIYLDLSIILKTIATVVSRMGV